MQLVNQQAFYTLPRVVVDKRTTDFKAQLGKRELTKEQYSNRSGLVAEPNFLDSFIIRQLYRKESIEKLNGNLMRDCANKALQEIRGSDYANFDIVQAEAIVRERLESNAMAVDTIYGDLYQALLHGKDESFTQANEETLAGAAMQRVMQHKSFPNMVKRINGRETLAGVFAAKVHETLTEYVSKLFASTFKSDAQNSKVDAPFNGVVDASKCDLGPLDKNGLDKVADSDQGLADDAAEKLDDAVDAISGSNQRGTGIGNHSEDISYAMECADCINELVGSNKQRNQLSDLLDCFGAVDDCMAAAIRSSKHGDGESMEIELGGDIFKATSSEMMNLAEEELELLFFARMAEHQLLEVHRYGLDEGGKGPIVILLDASGSMNSDVEFAGKKYSVLTVCAALAIALMKFAAKWHRPCAIIPFDDAVMKRFITVHEPLKNRNGKGLKAKLLKLAMCHPGGGTSWVPSLHGAGQYMNKMHAASFDNADVIYLTDGGGELQLHFGSGIPRNAMDIVRAKETFGESTRFYGLLVGSSYGTLQNRIDAETGLGYFFDEVVATSANNLNNAIGDLAVRLLLQSFYTYKGAEA